VADPTSIDKTPTQNQSLNKPEGGTYGEKAEVDRLKKELPSGQGPGGPPLQAPEPERSVAAPNKPVSGMPAPQPGGPSGLPDVLAQPSATPGQVSPRSPMAQGAGPQDISQARLALLDSLSNSQDVSKETREWAKIVLEMMVDASRS